VKLKEKGSAVWETGPWFLRSERCYLIPGDSPIGYRLPLDAQPWVKETNYPYVNEQDPLEEREALPHRQHFVRGVEGVPVSFWRNLEERGPLNPSEMPAERLGEARRVRMGPCDDADRLRGAAPAGRQGRGCRQTSPGDDVLWLGISLRPFVPSNDRGQMSTLEQIDPGRVRLRVGLGEREKGA